MIIDDIPLRVFKNKTKLQSLNLNRYVRNNFYVNKRLEKEFFLIFKEICAEQDCYFPLPPVHLHYTIYHFEPTIDLMNFGSVIDKFAQDALVKLGYLPNDNTDYVRSASFHDGGVDKDWPRASLCVESYQNLKRRLPLKILGGDEFLLANALVLW